MSWQISLIDNTVKIDQKIIDALFTTQKVEEYWWGKDEVAYENKITFNSDHAEHMGKFMHDPKIQKVLKDHKVKGRITFGSLEGDNDGEFWGFEFDGQGDMIQLVGTLNWTAK